MFRTIRTLAAVAFAAALLPLGAHAEQPGGIDIGFDPEPGDATFGYIPSSVAPADVIAVVVDRSGPLTTGVVLLKGGRTIEFSGVESRPFAILEAYEPALVAFAEK